MTSREQIPEDVIRFILVSIPSVPFLEALLMLRGEASLPWDARRVAARLYISDSSATDILSSLEAIGLLAKSDANTSYVYRPSSDSLAAMIARVAECYSKNLVGVTNLIHSKESKKAQKFADAFKW